jgi:hypothetical protein
MTFHACALACNSLPIWRDQDTLMHMVPNATDERLAWLAMRDYVSKRSRPSVLMRLLGAGHTFSDADYGGRVPAPRSEAHDMASIKAQNYAFAVDDAARELTPQERVVLRSTGHVPDWFIARVEELRDANG